MVARLTYFGKQIEEEVVPRGEYLHLVVLVGQGQTEVGEEVNQLLVGVWQLQFALLGVFQHAAFGEPVHAPLADEAFLSRVLSEEEVENDAHHRYECKYKKPRHSLGRLPMVHQNSHHHANGDDDIKCDYGRVEILHRHTCCYSCCRRAFVLLSGTRQNSETSPSSARFLVLFYSGKAVPRRLVRTTFLVLFYSGRAVSLCLVRTAFLSLRYAQKYALFL